MGIQDVGVFVIVAGAVVFLVRRVLPVRSEPAQTIVPLTSIKHRRDHDAGCH
jgi:hypothetical protein